VQTLLEKEKRKNYKIVLESKHKEGDPTSPNDNRGGKKEIGRRFCI